MKAYERLLKYVKVHTSSDPKSHTTPSSKRQFDLANILVEELKELGVKDAFVDENCYVYGSLEPTSGYEDKFNLGFIAHLDTAPDYIAEMVNPKIIENYDGKDITLGENGKKLEVKDFPHLPNLKGRTLITTDGTTLLGADNKAGIAEIMTMVERIIKEGKPHGKISIGFTPDEEIGSGAELLDLEKFGAQGAYTVDGGPEGEVSYENFNASTAHFEIYGVNVHPGSAKNTMVNASCVAMEINAMLPNFEVPEHTENYEGFYHLVEMSGDVSHSKLEYILRDHSSSLLESKKQTLRFIEKTLNEKYGESTVTLTISDSYKNMVEKIKPVFHLVETAIGVTECCGLEPIVVPVRGGTDGSRLSFRGLPCPNIGTGGYGYHGPYEHITVEGMDKAVEILLGIVTAYSLKN